MQICIEYVHGKRPFTTVERIIKYIDTSKSILISIVELRENKSEFIFPHKSIARYIIFSCWFINHINNENVIFCWNKYLNSYTHRNARYNPELYDLKLRFVTMKPQWNFWKINFCFENTEYGKKCVLTPPSPFTYVYYICWNRKYEKYFSWITRIVPRLHVYLYGFWKVNICFYRFAFE